MNNLIEKYNVPVPRYTSYPTVPNWDNEKFDKESYLIRLESGFSTANREGLSIYIHLPYCESLCTYCGCNTRITVNHKVEKPYIDAVLREWELVKMHFTGKPKIREIHLGGGTPTFFSADHLIRLIDGITKDSHVADEASFSFEAHPANTTYEHLEKLRRAGFDRLSLGIQDFDLKVQKAINRRQTTADVQRVVTEARELGYRSINFDLIYGLPFQTPETTAKTVEEVLQMRPDRIAYYSYAHVPWMRPGQRAYSESDLPGPKLKLELFMGGREQLLEGGYRAIGFDHFALPEDQLYKAFSDGRMHRNFMGFSELKTPYQIGLGVSSISDIGNGFAQNAKAVEPYIEKVNRNEIPIVKGHLHTDSDSYIRKHILNLTCRLNTSWAYGSSEEQVYMRSRIRQLKPLEADGLVQLKLDGLVVTEMGQHFIRQICAVFDRDYIPAQTSKRYAQGI
ncbi:MAG: oxygen-independent coproporphyrinogen III oxidase [Cryomorphaceae bacterium]|nr:oxygen-independent coproporphyrinogen III oxidase [Flavobacteriales bacterium]